MLLIDPIDEPVPADDEVVMMDEEGLGETGASSEGRDVGRKKRVRVINRRGPSEIDKAIRMSQAMKDQSRSGRKGPDRSPSRGTIIRIDKAKGFGFVIDSAGEHRFFHRSAVLEGGFAALKEQQLVEFEPQSDERGARAVSVRPAGTTPRADKPSSSLHPSRKPSSTPAWRSDLSPFRNGTGSPNSRRKW
jgi:cold shock protein